MIRRQIETAVAKVLSEMGANVPFVVERPAHLTHGDYATNAALAAAKTLTKNPREVAEELLEKLQSSLGADVERAEIAGAGFINFYLSRAAVSAEVKAAATEAGWGKVSVHEGKTVMVEYTDPNPFKEFHIGHLMSNAIGESVARLLEHSGAKVLRANYQGDVGPHVAKALWGRMQKPGLSWGEAYVYGNELYEANKEKIDSINKKVYDRSDEEVNQLYEQGRRESLEHFEKLYETLGTKFDHYFFESETAPLGLALVRKHPDVFVESDGAVVFRGEEHGLHTRVFINQLGLPTYEAKDLGLAELKKESVSFDRSITVTASEQTEYFRVVLKALEQVHPEWTGQFEHISHGMMRFAEGKMSSRKGNVVTGESLLEDMQAGAEEKMRGREIADAQKVAEQIAVGAIKYTVLRQGSGKDIVFDPEQSLSLEGDSGPYLQYAHTRALSLLREAEKAGIEPDTSDAPSEPSALERTLLHFPDVLERAARELEPHYVTTYLTELAGAFNSWYASGRVIGGEHPHSGVLLTKSFQQTMQRGLAVLGIPAPQEM